MSKANIRQRINYANTNYADAFAVGATSGKNWRMDIAKILRGVLDSGRFSSQEELADFLETSQANVSRYLKNRQVPSGPMLLRIMNLAQELGIDMGLSERGQSDLGPLSLQGFALVPRYEITAGAGNGRAVVEALPAEHLAFKADWLHELGLSPERAAIITAIGDSMAPTIPDGAIMLVDVSEGQALRNGCLYIVVLGGDVLVKRVARRADGSIDLISDNPAYPVDTITEKHLDKLTIPGRVVWVGRSV